MPSADALFDKIDGSTVFEIFDPKIADEADDSENVGTVEQLQIETLEDTVAEERDEKSVYLSKYSTSIKRQNQLLVYNPTSNPIAAVKSIDKEAREFVDETGVNVAYLAFGFSSDYVLAIECDGTTYHSSKNARDRDRLRQEILERMGWKFYRPAI